MDDERKSRRKDAGESFHTNLDLHILYVCEEVTSKKKNRKESSNLRSISGLR